MSTQRSFPIHEWKELESLPRREYLIKGVFDRNALSVVYGQSNSGKTFFVLDIAAHIASGMSWQGYRTRQGKVLYIAAEGGLGVAERLEAFRKHHEMCEYGALYVLPSGISLCGENSDTEALIESLSELGKFEVVIIDTLSRAMAGGNENSSEDMSDFIKSCDKIREALDTHVLIIHHSGKDQSKGARGHSALRAAVDTEIEITNDQGVISAKIVKQRDGKKDEEFHFTLKVVTLGKDEDGDDISSCVLENTEVHADKKKRLSGQRKRARDIFIRALDDKGEKRNVIKGMRAVRCIALAEFREALQIGNLSSAPKKDSINKAITRAIDSLNNAGITCSYGDYIWLVDSQDK